MCSFTSAIMRSFSLLQEVIVPIIGQLVQKLTEILIQVSKVCCSVNFVDFYFLMIQVYLQISTGPINDIHVLIYGLPVYNLESQQAAFQPLSVRVVVSGHKSHVSHQPRRGGDVRGGPVPALPTNPTTRCAR